MTRTRTAALVAFTFTLGACPDDHLVVSNGELDAAPDVNATGIGGSGDPAGTGGAAGDPNGGTTVIPSVGTGGLVAVGTGGAVQGTGGVVVPVTGQGGSGSAGLAAGGGSGLAGQPGTGGASGTGGAVGAGGAQPGGEGPCDIYAAANPPTPCVGAFSMTRVLAKSYTGPLYQVRKGGTWTSLTGMSGGTFLDIEAKDGFADAAAQDEFCGSQTCTVSKLYDQSGQQNHLTVAPKGCYTGTASEPDSEGSATRKSLSISGHRVYALYMNPHDGYRNNNCTGVPTGNADQSVYVLADGTHAGSACCWDFGNVWPDNCNTHTMAPIFFGTGYWGKGAGSGPWFMGDFEGGVWAGGSGASTTPNNNNPAMKVEFAFGILKTSSGKYAIRVANGQSGDLITAYDGASPKTWNHGGALLLGIGGDNSNSSFGTFYEGVATSGRPSDETDLAVLKNVQAAGYGK